MEGAAPPKRQVHSPLERLARLHQHSYVGRESGMEYVRAEQGRVSSSQTRPSQARSSLMVSLYSGLALDVSESSIRRSSRFLGLWRAERKVAPNASALPRCRWPEGVGASRPTVSLGVLGAEEHREEHRRRVSMREPRHGQAESKKKAVHNSLGVLGAEEHREEHRRRVSMREPRHRQAESNKFQGWGWEGRVRIQSRGRWVMFRAWRFRI